MRIKQATFAKCLMFVNVLLKLNVSCIPGISALGRLRQEICKFEASLGYVVRLPQNKTLQTVVLGVQERLLLSTLGILTLHIENDRGVGWPATPWVLQGAVKLMLGTLGSDSERAGASREGLPAHAQ